MIDTDSSGDKLTPKQQELITLLVSGIAIQAAAKNVGVGEATAYRWLRLEHFQKAYKAAQQSLFDERLNILRAGISSALLALQRNMTDKETVPPSTQVRAAQIWLEQAIQLHKMTELENRIAELEEYIESKHRR